MEAVSVISRGFQQARWKMKFYKQPPNDFRPVKIPGVVRCNLMYIGHAKCGFTAYIHHQLCMTKTASLVWLTRPVDLRLLGRRVWMRLNAQRNGQKIVPCLYSWNFCTNLPWISKMKPGSCETLENRSSVLLGHWLHRPQAVWAQGSSLGCCCVEV